MEFHEMIWLGIGVLTVAMFAIYDAIMRKSARKRIRDAKACAAEWQMLYNSAAAERDFLQRRLASKECQKVLCIQTKLDDANLEIERLLKVNETYKRQIESGKKRKAAPGGANAESCK